MSSRPRRAAAGRALEKLVVQDLPFPEGLPHPSNQLDCLWHRLTTLNHPSERMARVDDVVIRVILESKKRKANKIPTDSAKFTTGLLAAETCLKASQAWTAARNVPLNEWPDAATKPWAALEDQLEQLGLIKTDEVCFER